MKTLFESSTNEIPGTNSLNLKVEKYTSLQLNSSSFLHLALLNFCYEANVQLFEGEKIIKALISAWEPSFPSKQAYGQLYTSL